MGLLVETHVPAIRIVRLVVRRVLQHSVHVMTIILILSTSHVSELTPYSTGELVLFATLGP